MSYDLYIEARTCGHATGSPADYRMNNISV